MVKTREKENKIRKIIAGCGKSASCINLGKEKGEDKMKLIRTEDAVGSVLCHDITQIIPGVVKDGQLVVREKTMLYGPNYPKKK